MSSVIDDESKATRESVQNYYGKTLQTSADLKTNACCTAAAPPKYIKACLSKLHPTTLAKYYGCGLCLPDYDLEGASILDLGCGAGRDVYLASQLVGPTGRVVGVDMTKEQLDVAIEFQKYHAEKFGYSNTEFVQGYLESMAEISELKPGSFDLIISNCVINLCTDKQAVLKACYNLLKPGGELYFSDVYANRRVPKSLQQNEILWGECISGALYWNDFMSIAKQAGFTDPRLVEDSPLAIENKKISQMIWDAGCGATVFYSATYRLIKNDKLDAGNEDYGQAVIYKGTIPRAASWWRLDKHHTFEVGRVYPVCGNTWRMLECNPRLKPHFDFIGTFDRHYGSKNGALPFDEVFNAAENGGTTEAVKSSSCCPDNNGKAETKSCCSKEGKKSGCC